MKWIIKCAVGGRSYYLNERNTGITRWTSRAQQFDTYMQAASRQKSVRGHPVLYDEKLNIVMDSQEAMTQMWVEAHYANLKESGNLVTG